MVTAAGEAANVKLGGAATDRVVDPATLPEVAEMVVVPAATAVASPAMLIVATAPLEDSQLALVVRFFVLLSL